MVLQKVNYALSVSMLGMPGSRRSIIKTLANALRQFMIPYALLTRHLFPKTLNAIRKRPFTTLFILAKGKAGDSNSLSPRSELRCQGQTHPPDNIKSLKPKAGGMRIVYLSLPCASCHAPDA